MTALADALRGVNFFMRYSASFTKPGMQARRLFWPTDNWDLSDQTWLVTGGTGGIGRAVVLSALAHGATVIALARNADKLEALQQDAASHAIRLRLVQVDLSLKSDVVATAHSLAKEAPSIDVLVNNVGILNNRWQQTSEGHEESYATNILNQHALTTTLLAEKALSETARVIAVVSGGLYTNSRNLQDLDQAKSGFDGVAAYAAHKRAQLALMDHYRLLEGHREKRFYAMHPGWVDTAGVARSLPAFRRLYGPLLRDSDEGADTILWLGATGPEEVEDQVWFDRAPRPAHIYNHTRRHAVPVADIVTYLDNDLADEQNITQ